MPIFYQGMPLVCHSLHHLLKSFTEWLASYKHFVLFAHKSRKFDSFVLCSAKNKLLDVKLHECVSGFCDTLHFFRSILPIHRKTVHLSFWYHIFWDSYTIRMMLWRTPCVTKIQWVTSACSWYQLFKSYIWCIKDL